MFFSEGREILVPWRSLKNPIFLFYFVLLEGGVMKSQCIGGNCFKRGGGRGLGKKRGW